MESFKEEYKQRLRHVHGFDFKEMALALFRFQFEYNLTYQAYVNARGIDFVGYVFYHTHTLLRKSIKQNLARMIVGNKNQQSMASYFGWAKHCNSINLLKKLGMNSFSQYGIKPTVKGYIGDKIEVKRLLNKPIIVHEYKIDNSKHFADKGLGKCLHMQISFNDEKRVVFTSGTALIDMISKIPENGFPFTTTIVKDNERFMFT